MKGTSAEASFRESLKAFNAKGSRDFTRDSVDVESQETLLGSISSRASKAMSSIVGPKNTDKEFFGWTIMQRYLGFGCCLAASALCFIMSFFTLPIVLLSPGKFALTWTTGSFLFLFSFAILNGAMAHLKHLCSSPRLPFTAAYITSMILTLYFTVIDPSYVLVIFFCVIQSIALSWYLSSYLPGSTSGLRVLSRGAGLPI